VLEHVDRIQRLAVSDHDGDEGSSVGNDGNSGSGDGVHRKEKVVGGSVGNADVGSADVDSEIAETTTINPGSASMQSKSFQSSVAPMQFFESAIVESGEAGGSGGGAKSLLSSTPVAGTVAAGAISAKVATRETRPTVTHARSLGATFITREELAHQIEVDLTQISERLAVSHSQAELLLADPRVLWSARLLYDL
jgi:hypothetical protein